MKKISDDDLTAVSRSQSLSKYGDPERRGIYGNSFFIGAMAARDQKKRLTEAELKKKAKTYAESSYYSDDRIAIAIPAYIDGANYITK